MKKDVFFFGSGLSNTDLLYSEMRNENNYLKSDLNTFIVPPILDKQSQDYDKCNFSCCVKDNQLSVLLNILNRQEVQIQ